MKATYFLLFYIQRVILITDYCTVFGKNKITSTFSGTKKLNLVLQEQELIRK